MKSESLLYRIVHVSWVQNGRFTSQIFQPTGNNPPSLHVYHGGLITPEEAWLRFTGSSSDFRGFVGVVGVSIAECQTLQLLVNLGTDLGLEQATIEFAGMSRSQIRRTAVILREMGASRGWLFRPKRRHITA